MMPATLAERLWRPRLGTLHHHPPRPLRLPAPYIDARPSASPRPRISIVTPSFNAGPFIARTIASVVSQGYPNLEYVVQDGASTDDTVAAIMDFQADLASVESVPDRGQSDAINRGFQRTTGEILAYLNADDLLLPGALAYVGAYFAVHPTVDVVYGHRVLIDDEDREVGRWVMPPHDGDVLSWADYIPQETLFWRRRAWDRVDARVDDTFQFAMDWDLLVRLRDTGAVMVRLPRFLGAFRVHPEQKSSAQLATLGEREMMRIRQRILGRSVGYEEISRRIRPYLLRHMLYQKLYRLGLLGD
jgi:glycosyltransferase involved in cell wall biosynthesis